MKNSGHVDKAAPQEITKKLAEEGGIETTIRALFTTGGGKLPAARKRCGSKRASKSTAAKPATKAIAAKLATKAIATKPATVATVRTKPARQPALVNPKFAVPSQTQKDEGIVLSAEQ